MKRLLLLLTIACCMPARADFGSQQVALASSGRFDQLEQMLEQQAERGPLDTRDRHALCYAYSKTKRYTQLMACLDQLAARLKEGGERSTRLFGLDDATPALGLMRAEALVELGQYAAAAAQARSNLEWLEKDGGGDLDMIYNSMAALSIAHTMAGERDKGAEVANRIARSGGNIFSSYSSSRALALARARMALGDYKGVLEALDSDKLFAVNIALDRIFSGSYLTGVNNWLWVELPRAFMMNKALMETGRVEQARSGFDRLLAMPQVRENGEISWLLQFERGRIAEQEGDRAAALALYRAAIDTVEAQRASINTEANKIGFVGDKQALYGRAINTALSLQKDELAYELIERSKSRALVDLLAARGGAQLRGQHAESARLLASYQQAAERSVAQLPVDMAHAGGDSARKALKLQEQQLRSADPALASLVSVDALTLAQVRRHLHPDEVLLEYYQSGDKLVLVGVSSAQVMTAQLEGARLEPEVRAFRSLIEQQKPEALAAAQQLYKRLLAPAGSMIAGRKLLIVPHGALHYLPFAALHDGQDYLLARHELRFLPSASVQQFLRPARAAAMDSMLIFGNPDLGDARLDLPGTEHEAREIAKLAPQSRILTRRAASETAFKEAAGQYGYLHMAAHGEFHGDSPLQSRLLFAPDRQNDGSLTLSEIYALRLNADLVTLSACETGLTKAQNGDDVIGMTRGFLYAGSSNIIASLWEVDDNATAALMTHFYRNVKAGQPKGKALRAAQESLRASYPAPRFWAAFYLTGQGI
ncbi:CHAT domain-containing protein [Pseudoduganella sp. OTU4001]|uniref:CHAT domain-containing protein n=1 Tax=Pseudoduganella sp. OTU4001 TaxID=3043854 RepID=UPI00313DFDD6